MSEVVGRDADLPTVTIEADRTPITEGGTASFTVSVAGAKAGDALLIAVELSQVGEFANLSSESRTVTWAFGWPPQKVTVPTINDAVDEPDGRIVAQVQPQPGEFVVVDPGAAEVVMQDNDLPTVTISADRTPIAEGETASFTVTLSTPAPDGGRNVVVEVSQEGDFAAGTLPETRTVTVPAGQATASVSVATLDDTVDEPDGKIIAQVVEQATVYTVGTPGTAEVVVQDANLPRVTVTAARPPIAEGETASFTVTLSTPAPDGGRNVVVEVSQEGDLAADTLPETRTVTVPAGQATATVSVLTIDDTVDEPDGKIVAQVVEQATVYTVGTPGTAEVVVQDNDLLALTITAERTPITEGETASFTVSLSTPAPDGGLVVEVALSEGGEGGFTDTLPETRTVTVLAGDRTVTVSVATIDDTVDEPDGTVIAGVVERATAYTVGTPGTAEVVVQDNDLPAVAIEAERTPITEGETASFTVSLSTPAPDGGLVVEVALSEDGEGGFTDTLPETRTVTVLAGDRKASVSVPTIDDTVAELDGTIVAQVQPQPGVFLVGTPGTAEVVVQDNDLPAVTIEADRTPITEGGTASFTVSVAGAKAGDALLIAVELSQVGEFANLSSEPRTVTWAFGWPPQKVTVTTINDTVDEPDGRIVAQVQPQPGEFVVEDPGAAEVVMQDNDLPTVTISADRTPIAEGETASFTVTLSTPAPDGGRNVVVEVSQEGDFAAVALPQTRTVTVPAGQSTASVNVPTLDDTVDEPDGKIVATVGTPGTVEVVVQDNDLFVENEAPSFRERYAIRYVGEETVVGAAFGAPVSATDADDDTLAYALGGSDAENFDIDDATGQLRTKTRLEYETKRTHNVAVSVSDGRGGSDRVEVEIRVLDTLVTVPVASAVERRVQVTANASTIDEGDDVTFTFTSLETAPAGGADVFYSLKQVAVDYDAEAYDFRPLPHLNTHHHTRVTIPAGNRSASVTYRTGSDRFEETDVRLVVDIGGGSVSNFNGEPCFDEDGRNLYTLVSRPAGCTAEVGVRDRGGTVDRPEPIPFARYASAFPGHVTGFTGQNHQFINAGDPKRFTISLNVPAPRGGLEVGYALYEKASDFIGDVPTYPGIVRRSVTIPEGESEVFLTIPTLRTDTVTEDCESQGREGEGCISVRITTPPYAVTPDGHGYLPYLHFPAALRYSMTTIVRSSPVVSPDLPTVTIEADRTPIAEGETASFTVTVSTPAPSGWAGGGGCTERGGRGGLHGHAAGDPHGDRTCGTSHGHRGSGDHRRRGGRAGREDRRAGGRAGHRLHRGGPGHGRGGGAGRWRTGAKD